MNQSKLGQVRVLKGAKGGGIAEWLGHECSYLLSA